MSFAQLNQLRSLRDISNHLDDEQLAEKNCPAQQGSTGFRVNIFGKAAHGGKRYHGISVIEKATSVVNSIAELEKYRNEKYTNPLYEGNPIPFTINVGTIEGGDWPSSASEMVSIEGRVGISPAEDIKDGWKMFIQKLAERSRSLKEPPELQMAGY